MTDLVVLGAGGDLAGRYLLPAVAELQAAGRFSADCRVLGVDRQGWDSEEFRSRVGERLHRRGVTGAAITTLLGRLEYRRCDVTDAEGLRAALAPHMAYLAQPPAVFSAAVEALAALPLPSGSRVVVQKPFGEDPESARALNRLLHRSFAEEAVFSRSTAAPGSVPAPRPNRRAPGHSASVVPRRGPLPAARRLLRSKHFLWLESRQGSSGGRGFAPRDRSTPPA